LHKKPFDGNMCVMFQRGAKLAVIAGLLTSMVAGLFAPATTSAFPGSNGQILVKALQDVTEDDVYVLGIAAIDLEDLIGELLYEAPGPQAVMAGKWSPDGTRVAYEINNIIYVMNADGSNQQAISSATPFLDLLGWAPDGLRLLVVNNYNGWMSVMNADGSGLIPLTNFPVYSADWSPATNLILMSTPGHGFCLDIYTMKPDGTALASLKTTTTAEYRPAWSPNGQYIVYDETNGSDNFKIHRMQANGTNDVILTPTNQMSYGAVWAPDGTKLLYIADLTPQDTTPHFREVRSMNPDGSGSLYHFDYIYLDSDIDWQPITSPFVYRLANWKTHERLFTTNPYEALAAPHGGSGWVLEGLGFRAASHTTAGAQPVYRLANWMTKERLFTTSAAERDNAVANLPGWVSEGTALYSVPCGAGTTTVYRMANWMTKERLFTTNASEVSYALAHYPGWVNEGVAFCTPAQ
jgi:Tol biopolymer transport system component